LAGAGGRRRKTAGRVGEVKLAEKRANIKKENAAEIHRCSRAPTHLLVQPVMVYVIF
jgi:hypothetical protein